MAFEVEIIYLRMRHRVFIEPNETVRLGHVAHIVGSSKIRKELAQLPLHEVKPNDCNFIVIDAMHAIDAVYSFDRSLDVQIVGPAQSIVEVRLPKKTLAPIYFCGVWVLLFIGAALAIMNFHEDVSMQAVQQKIFKIITGKDEANPLILQIPYSFGLGIGMILFFNHLFKKKFNEEPSPLEVEMFNYQQDLDRYVVFHDKKESDSKPDDH